MVDSQRNALPWQQNMPISMDHPPEMATLPEKPLIIEKFSPADMGKAAAGSAFCKLHLLLFAYHRNNSNLPHSHISRLCTSNSPTFGFRVWQEFQNCE
jgi:hypothetical protein